MKFHKNFKLAKYSFLALQIQLLHLQLFYSCNIMPDQLNKDHLNYQDDFHIYQVHLMHILITILKYLYH